MAIVIDGFTGVFKRVPFVKPPDLQRMFTALPRSIVHFNVINQTLSAKPLNDQQQVQVILNLPFEFAYRMVDAIMSLRQDVANNFNDSGQLEITNSLRGQPLGQVNRHVLRGTDTTTFTPFVADVLVVPDRVPTYIMQSVSPGISPGLDFRMINLQAAASAAGFINFFASFYEYDIEQVQMFPPLVPGALTYALQ